MLITIPFADRIGWEKGEILGYTGIVALGAHGVLRVRSYRENAGGGRLTFGRGFACRHPDYVDLQRVLRGDVGDRLFQTDARVCGEICRAHGGAREGPPGQTSRGMEETERQAKQFKQMYSNPAINVALTFMEVFPIGLGVTLLSGRDSPEEGARA